MDEDWVSRRDAAREKKTRRAREAKTVKRREQAIRAEAECREIEALIRQRQEAVDALTGAPGSPSEESDLRIRKLQQEISYLGHALYLLKKSGRSGR